MNLPGWVSSDRFSENQLPVVDEIIERFDEGSDLVLVDAPTGAGKSLIAEAVRLRLQVRSTLLTHSIVLQHQYEHDFEDRAVVIKGRSNYSPQNLEADWKGNVPTCADCTYDPRSELCDFCPEPESCAYNVAKQAADMADVAVANYAYFLNETKGKHSILSGRELCVADECDMLEGELLNHVQIDVSPRMQRMLRLEPPERKTKQSAWQDWFEYAIPHVKERLQYLPASSLEEKRFRRRVSDLLIKLKSVGDDLSGWIYTGYSNKADQSFITFKPIKVDQIAPKILWPHAKRWLAMSATIISPEEFVQSLGYEGPWSVVYAPSTFDRERRRVNYIPVATMTKKNEIEAWPKMAEALVDVCGMHPDERILVHTVSYNLTRHLYYELQTRLGRKVLCYLSAKERNDAIASFESTEGVVLLAPSLDRGYDGKDDLCRVVVVCKVPFPFLGDKQVSARIHTRGGQLWYDVQTARSIVQMVGRGMRHEDDHMTGYILDASFGLFFDKYGNGNDGRRAHRLFPNWFVEAIDWNSDQKFELRRLQRERKEGSEQALASPAAHP